ncbi:S1-like domain-containing RNA-binding protein [Spirosoma sp. SC4-14]|uniref:CvfB family protein n=1 Tax=Spirosoma sp. SC4-14 TaxID=3128900 RepID=UPI0030CBDCD8
MLRIGRMNRLTALRETSVGFFLGDPYLNNPNEDVLLPNKYVPESLAVGEEIDVFVYTDSEDRPIATTLTPHIMRDEFAPLPVVSVTGIGAFLNWGLEKDLFVPHKEQSKPMEAGQWYVVYLYLDRRTNRLVASSKISRFLDMDVSELREGDAVDLLAYERTDLGFNVIINDRYQGLLYRNEIFQPIQVGDRMPGYIKRIRDDNRIDVSLQQEGYQNVEPNAQRILDTLKTNSGFLPLTDKSDPQLIYRTLEMSKKTFKKAIGTLYRERKIVLREDGIALV